MSRRPDQFSGLDELLIDGHNLLHRISGSADPAARHSLLARLRASLPVGLRAVVVLDGPPDPGGPLAQRISPQLEVRHSGRRDADGLIVALVAERPYGARARIAVVSDDRALRDRVRQIGGATRRLSWLTDGWHLERPSGARPGGARSTGLARPTGPGRAGLNAPPAVREDVTGDVPEREAWQPGRGATTKRGNPRRAARPGRHRTPRDDGRTL
ncbi:MAG: hypothetical protein ACXVAP_07320 [Candidatus Limnocylindrales bacterium]